MATFKASTEQWRPLVRRFAGDLPLDFLMAFVDEESGGNPCSLGIPNVEAGLFQTFHPSDDRFGATFGQLRAACSGSTLVRQLSSDEQVLQVTSGIGLVRDLRERARRFLAAVGARWSEGSVDFWNFVKLGHGLPAIQGQLLPQIAQRLGRAPASWAEFRREVMATPASSMPQSLVGFANAPSVRGLRNRIEDVLVNAEHAGQHGGGLLSNPLAIAVFAMAGAAGVLVYLIRRRRQRR